MDLFKRNHISADFYAVPAEPSRTELAPQVIDREQVVAAFDELIFWASRQGYPEVADRLIDERRNIRAPRVATVPVIPGRPS